MKKGGKEGDMKRYGKKIENTSYSDIGAHISFGLMDNTRVDDDFFVD